MTFDIYTKGACPYCVKAKALLDAKGYKYREFTVGNGVLKEDIQQRIIKLGSSAKVNTVPQIFLIKNGLESYIGGCEDLVSKIDSL